MLKKMLCIGLVLVMLGSFVSADAKTVGFGGEDEYNISWTDRSGFLWLNKDKYTATAKYTGSYIVMLDKLTKTGRWDNYRNKIGTPDSMTISLTQSITVGSTTSRATSSALGFKIPLGSGEISAQIGGSKTKSVTYSVSSNNTISYTLSHQSINGYYAIVHVINADKYDIDVKKNGKAVSEGNLLRFSNNYGYYRLWHSNAEY